MNEYINFPSISKKLVEFITSKVLKRNANKQFVRIESVD